MKFLSGRVRLCIVKREVNMDFYFFYYLKNLVDGSFFFLKFKLF